MEIYGNSFSCSYNFIEFAYEVTVIVEFKGFAFLKNSSYSPDEWCWKMFVSFCKTQQLWSLMLTSSAFNESTFASYRSSIGFCAYFLSGTDFKFWNYNHVMELLQMKFVNGVR